ncbi:unnamed protein product [Malus baccata var. baccata]
MGQGTPGGLNRQGLPGDRKPDGNDKKEKKFEPAALLARVGRKQRKKKGPEAAARLPTVTPLTECKLRQLKLERIKHYTHGGGGVMNQEPLKPQKEKGVKRAGILFENFYHFLKYFLRTFLKYNFF